MLRSAPRSLRQRGLAAVELALLTPVLLLAMFFTAEIARALYQYNTLTKSVRDGAQYLARYGVIVGTGVLAPTAAEETAARNLVAYGSPVAGTALLPGLAPGDVNLAYAALYGPVNDTVTVSIDYEYQPLFAVLPAAMTQGKNIAGGFEMSASLRMRAL
jgi:Flp pilus assembly protein TadG